MGATKPAKTARKLSLSKGVKRLNAKTSADPVVVRDSDSEKTVDYI